MSTFAHPYMLASLRTQAYEPHLTISQLIFMLDPPSGDVRAFLLFLCTRPRRIQTSSSILNELDQAGSYSNVVIPAYWLLAYYMDLLAFNQSNCLVTSTHISTNQVRRGTASGREHLTESLPKADNANWCLKQAGHVHAWEIIKTLDLVIFLWMICKPQTTPHEQMFNTFNPVFFLDATRRPPGGLHRMLPPNLSGAPCVAHLRR